MYPALLWCHPPIGTPDVVADGGGELYAGFLLGGTI